MENKVEIKSQRADMGLYQVWLNDKLFRGDLYKGEAQHLATHLAGDTKEEACNS